MLGDQVITRHGHVGEGGVQCGVSEQVLERERISSRTEIRDGEGLTEFVRGDVDLRLEADALAELIETRFRQGLTLF
jgi:hypothetical protein